MLDDLRGAWRLIWRTPAASIGTILSLGLGIGVTTALFSVVHALLIAPLPYIDPERLVTVIVNPSAEAQAAGARTSYAMTGAEAEAVRTLPVFEDVAVFELWTTSRTRMTLTHHAEAERLRVALVEPNFFSLLGVRPAAGRAFVADDSPDAVAVISHLLWQRQFGGDPRVIGQVMHLGGLPRTIIGVLPAGLPFTYPEETEAWCLRPSRVLMARVIQYHAIGRVKADMTPAAVDAALASLAAQPLPIGRGRTSSLQSQPLQSWATSEQRPALAMLSAVAALLCLIACANAGLILVTRAARRARVFALHAAVGATSGRLIRAGLFETAVIGVAGTLVGVLFATVAHPLIKFIVPFPVPRLDEMTMNGEVLAFAVGTGMLTSLLAGLGGYRIMAAKELTSILLQGGPTATISRGGVIWRHLLLGAQSAVIVTVLVIAGLLLQSFRHAWSIDVGFETAQRAAVHVRLDVDGRGDWRNRAAFVDQELRRRIRALPGIADVATAATLPLGGQDMRTWVPQPAIPQGSDGTPRTAARARFVSPDWFRVMDVRLRDGRAFTDHDDSRAAKVTILSASLARAVFGREDVVGRTLEWSEPYQIVGIVDDVRWARLEEAPQPAFYVPLAQRPSATLALVAVSRLEPQAFATAVADVMRQIDRGQPVDNVTTLDRLLDEATAARRFYAASTFAFGGLALLLGIVGMWGSVEAATTERTREIGIRIVLGASPGDVRWLVLMRGLKPVAIGVVAGAIAAFWITQLLRNLLFEVSPLDPLALTIAPLTVALAALGAAWRPIARALRVHPIEVLRDH